MSKLRHFKKITSPPHVLTPDELQISVNKSAEHLRILWISYSLFAVYLIITSLSVTHRHLFLELPVKLPVLNIDLGLRDFFIISPILFIGMHLYLVFHINVLRQQVVKYQDIICNKTRLREKKSYLFDPFIFVQSWVGHAKGWRSKIGFLIITRGTLEVFSICVLLLIMLSALPYHDEKLTNYHRIMVMLDFVVIVVLGVNWKKGLWHLMYRILWKKKLWGFIYRNLWKRTLRPLIFRILVTFISFIILSITLLGILVFKGEELYDIQCPILKPITKFLLEGEANYITGKPKSLFANRLILVNGDFADDKLLEELKEKEEKEEKETPPTSRNAFCENYKDTLYEIILSKRGRHFENAVFDYSDLRRIDFTGAYISGASFVRSNLEMSDFSCGDLPPNNNREECLAIKHQDVNFQKANLKKSNFSYIQLRGSDFISADLEKAKLNFASLQGSNLRFSKLQNTCFNFAQLQAVNFKFAQLQNANFSFSGLQSANFEFSRLQNANLKCANLEKAFLKYTNVWNTNFNCAIQDTTSKNPSTTQKERFIKTIDFIEDEDKEKNNAYDNGKKEAFLNNIIFGKDPKIGQYWHKHLSEMKDTWEKKCKGHEKENTMCDDSSREEWFQEFINSINTRLEANDTYLSQEKAIKAEDIRKHATPWKEAKNNSKYKKGETEDNKAAEDRFLKDFWQYRVEHLICGNDKDNKIAGTVTVDAIITRLNTIPYAYFCLKDQQYFATILFEKIDAGQCPLNSALTDEQLTILKEWKTQETY